MVHTQDMTPALALKEFKAVADLLVEPQVFWDGHDVRKVAGLYRRVRGQLTARGGDYRAVAGSRPPCNAHALDWLRRVDATPWLRRVGGGTVHALKVLSTQPYGPDEVGKVQGWTAEAQQWCVEAAEIVGDTRKPIPLRKACPLCLSLFKYVADGRKWALVADNDIVRCTACHAEWPHESWGVLAGMLNA